MPELHTSTATQTKSLQGFRRRRFNQDSAVPVDTDLIRILVLDQSRETLEHLEKALWMWPHKVANASSVNEAVEMCQQHTPTALIAGVEFSESQPASTISTLRKELPQVPIIAIGSTSDSEIPGDIVDQGADAFLPREDLHRPTLRNLLKQVQRTLDSEDTQDLPTVPKMPLPWRESEIIGALICDISGTITDANDCIATWLGYPDTDALLGKCVWRDLLNSPADWSAWKKTAGDVAALLHQFTCMTAKNGQILWMKVEVFAAPNFPSRLQAVFVNRTELVA